MTDPPPLNPERAADEVTPDKVHSIERRRTRYNVAIDPRIPGALSVWWIVFMAALAFAVVAAGALAAQWALYRTYMLGSVIFSACMSGLLMFHITLGIRRRRRATARRLVAISELNHHIRNALQQIVAVTNVHALGGYAEIQSAIDRIDWILRDSSSDIRAE